jgi:hypothetical protein
LLLGGGLWGGGWRRGRFEEGEMGIVARWWWWASCRVAMQRDAEKVDDRDFEARVLTAD